MIGTMDNIVQASRPRQLVAGFSTGEETVDITNERHLVCTTSHKQRHNVLSCAISIYNSEIRYIVILIF